MTHSFSNRRKNRQKKLSCKALKMKYLIFYLDIFFVSILVFICFNCANIKTFLLKRCFVFKYLTYLLKIFSVAKCVLAHSSDRVKSFALVVCSLCSARHLLYCSVPNIIQTGAVASPPPLTILLRHKLLFIVRNFFICYFLMAFKVVPMFLLGIEHMYGYVVLGKLK